MCKICFITNTFNCCWTSGLHETSETLKVQWKTTTERNSLSNEWLKMMNSVIYSVGHIFKFN